MDTTTIAASPAQTLSLPNHILKGCYKDPFTGNFVTPEPLEVRWDFVMEELADCLPDNYEFSYEWDGDNRTVALSDDYKVTASYISGEFAVTISARSQTEGLEDEAHAFFEKIASIFNIQPTVLH